MKGVLLYGVLAFLDAGACQADNKVPQTFVDQGQYELFYEYAYQANFVERLLFECTADDGVWWTFATATARVTNAYKAEVLKFTSADPFTHQWVGSLLVQELVLNLSRRSTAFGDPANPVTMAQRDVLELVSHLDGDMDAMCDFVFWEEVGAFDEILSLLLRDARGRLEDAEFQIFSQQAEAGLPTIRKLFRANPVRSAISSEN